MKKKLGRDKQCAKCPWKKSTNPKEIPNGYSVKKHKALKGTIAEPGSLRRSGRVMACHEEHEAHCIGWLNHQLGPGNNIPLRIQMLEYDLSGMEVFGAQHERFEDTLPN